MVSNWQCSHRPRRAQPGEPVSGVDSCASLSYPPGMELGIDGQWIMFYRPMLTRTRVAVAFAIAIAADLAQLVLGPLGWFWPDQIIDVGAAIATMVAIG